MSHVFWLGIVIALMSTGWALGHCSTELKHA